MVSEASGRLCLLTLSDVVNLILTANMYMANITVTSSVHPPLLLQWCHRHYIQPGGEQQKRSLLVCTVSQHV